MPMLNQIPAVGAVLLCKGSVTRITGQLLLHKGEVHKNENMLRRKDVIDDELKP